jgi:hypothetical protein
VQTRLDRLLFHHRTTPHTATGVSPSELLMKRRLRTVMDRLRPGRMSRKKGQEFQQRTNSVLREFDEGDKVLTVNFGRRSSWRWLPGTVVKRLGGTNYEVRLDGGDVVHRHVDQLISSPMEPPAEPAADEGQTVMVSSRPSTPDSASSQMGHSEVCDEPAAEVTGETAGVASRDPEVLSEPAEATPLRRSTRERRAPAHLADYQ